jgi:hypothetical protein
VEKAATMAAAEARGERRQGQQERRAINKKTQTSARLVLVTRHDHIKEIVPQIVPRIVPETSSKSTIFLEVSSTILVLFVVLEIVPKIVPK